jgi:hypothetical protein
MNQIMALCIACIIIGQSAAFGQTHKRLDKLIKNKQINKIISTLAADNMGGRNAYQPQFSGKAAAYIASQFAKAGLQPAPGANDFFQKLPHVKISPNALEVYQNGQQIPVEKLLLSSENQVVTFGQNPIIKTIEKGQNFYSAFRNFTADSSHKIVVVAAEHAEMFARIKGYFGKPKILTTSQRNAGNTLFVLGATANVPFDIKNISQKEEPAQLQNIVGYLPGKTKPNEYIIFSAHYDHLGTLAAVNGDTIANGADDDASGTTAVISLARYFKKIKNNQRSILFVAFTAEEIGGYGSQFFSQQQNPDQVAAMINIEMIGKPSKWGQNAAFITGFERSSLGSIVQEDLKGSPFVLHPDPYPEQNLFYRSDNATLARLGVPAHSFSTDQIDTDPLYHTVDDETESLDIQNITATIKALAWGSRSLVAGKATPSRVDKSKVK